MTSDCIFCKIIAGEIPSEKIFENQDVLAFLDIHPVSRGHTLVVPKKHSDDFLSTEDEVLQILMPDIKKIGAVLMKTIGAEGINISTNHGVAAGQAVFHLHFHLIPRFSKDGLPTWPHHESESKTRKELAEEIKKFI